MKRKTGLKLAPPPAPVVSLADRKAERRAEAVAEIESGLSLIAGIVGATRARQIGETACRLIRLKVPPEAVSVCVEHIIKLALEEMGFSPETGGAK